MNKIFRRFIKNHTQGDEEKELFWWDFFFNYEVGIGFGIAAIFCLVTFFVMAVFSAFTFGLKIFDSILFVIGISLLIGGFFAFFIVSPLNDSDNVRKDNLKQGSLYLATALGHIANFIINWTPLLALVTSILTFKWNIIIGCGIGVALYYLLLGWVKPNAKDYVNWRFSWAIDNYESLFSGHYKWWTSAANMSVQKFHLKKFQKYKYHATLSLIMVPVLCTLLLFSASGFATKAMKRGNEIQTTTDSISTPDVVENTIIDEENNVEEEQYESTEPDEYMSQNETVNDDNQYNDYQESEERPSQSTTSSNATQSETKPKTEAVTRTNDQASAPPASPVKEERQATPQAEQRPMENAGPEFQGGNYALTSYIARHLHYPAAAMEKKIQGKVVVKLTISSTGQVSNAEILQSADDLLDAEALRLCRSLPHFTPARRNGQPVASTMTIPINFRL